MSQLAQFPQQPLEDKGRLPRGPARQTVHASACREWGQLIFPARRSHRALMRLKYPTYKVTIPQGHGCALGSLHPRETQSGWNCVGELSLTCLFSSLGAGHYVCVTEVAGRPWKSTIHTGACGGGPGFAQRAGLWLRAGACTCWGPGKWVPCRNPRTGSERPADGGRCAGAGRDGAGETRVSEKLGN